MNVSKIKHELWKIQNRFWEWRGRRRDGGRVTAGREGSPWRARLRALLRAMEALGEEGGQVPDWMPADSGARGGSEAWSSDDSGAGPFPGERCRGQLPDAVRRTPCCSLLGERYFVAWQGVLTLAFAGWPPSLEGLKRSLEDESPELLAPENAGSRWPKVTLGCMRDGATLTADQFDVLRAICDEETQALKREGAGSSMGVDGGKPVVGGGHRDVAWALPVDRVAVSLYACRSMERVLHVSEMRLKEAPRSELEGGQRPSLEEAMRVQDVLRSWDDREGYLALANQSGNREYHYRGNALQASLCIFLHSQGRPMDAAQGGGREEAPQELQGVLGREIEVATKKAEVALGALLAAKGGNDDAAGGDRARQDADAALVRGNAAGHFLPASLVRLRRRIDGALPDLYVWFDDHALHVTLRALA